MFVPVKNNRGVIYYETTSGFFPFTLSDDVPHATLLPPLISCTRSAKIQI